jgi:hypothetical protein
MSTSLSFMVACDAVRERMIAIAEGRGAAAAAAGAARRPVSLLSTRLTTLFSARWAPE